MFALVGRRENKQKKDQDSELPGYNIRWVLGFSDMKEALLQVCSTLKHRLDLETSKLVCSIDR